MNILKKEDIKDMTLIKLRRLMIEKVFWGFPKHRKISWADAIMEMVYSLPQVDK